jgi:hypothetical protein
MAATCTAKGTVWRWQQRFMCEGVDDLLHDRTRPPGKPPISDDRAAEVVRLTLSPPPQEATHWTARAMARTVGLAVSTIQKIWKAHGLAPHRWRRFKLSDDPAFADKLHAVVGHYLNPPAHAVVLSVDEKSQIQALDRIRPGLPLRKGRGATMTHDYKRHACPRHRSGARPPCSPRLIVGPGRDPGFSTASVRARNMQRHRQQAFISFVKAMERDIPDAKGSRDPR